LSNNRERQRAEHEDHRKRGRQPRQQRGTRARTERGLAASAAKRTGYVAALALLEQDHQQQHQADENVDRAQQVIEHDRV
jgi:hypothetical protein